MRIAFDWDDTLTPTLTALHALEPRPWLARLTGAEPLRAGAIALWRWLRAEGHEVWVLTSSLRSPRWIAWCLRAHGLAPSRVITDDGYRAELRRRGQPLTLSKDPRLWAIDLLVDDSPGVAAEGAAHGFAVLRIAPDDASWTARVRQAVDGRTTQRADGRPGPQDHP